MADRWENNGNSSRFSFLRLQNHCRSWLYPWNSEMLAPWKKSYYQARQHSKKQIYYFANKGPFAKAMVFPLVTHVCESWTIKKAEHRRTDTSELWCWRRLLRVPWTARRSNQSIVKEISPEYSLEELMLKLILQYFGHLLQITDSLEKTLMLWKIVGGRRRGNRGWDGWMASPTQCTWVWASSGCWWWTGKPGELQSTGSQRVRYNWVRKTESDTTEFRKLWTELNANEI